MLENSEELAWIEKILSKKKELRNPKKSAYKGGILSKSGKNIKSTTLVTPKVSIFIIPVNNSNFNSLYIHCIMSKQTQAIIWKPMTKANKKLEEVHINIWGPHYPLFLSSNTYVALLIGTKTRKSWIKYLWSKDKFVDIFQI